MPTPVFSNDTVVTATDPELTPGTVGVGSVIRVGWIDQVSAPVVTTDGSDMIVDSATGASSATFTLEHPGQMVRFLYYNSEWLMSRYSPGNPMNWKGPWVPATYYRGDVVTDEFWTMIASGNTDDKPAPVPLGDPFLATDIVGAETFSDQTDTVNQLIVGQRYTFDNSGYLKSVLWYEADSTTGMKVTVWLVVDPTGSPAYSVIVPEFVIGSGDIDQWVEFPVGQVLVAAGTTFDILMAIRPVAGESSFTESWDYVRANGSPGAGEAYHHSGQNQDELWFNETDALLVDQTSELDNVVPGSTITMASSGFVWDVIAATKVSSVYQFNVVPASRAAAATSDFTFTYTAAIAVKYVQDTNFYSGESQISGVIISDAVETLDQNLYGVDIKVQQITKSDDWEVMSLSE